MVDSARTDGRRPYRPVWSTRLIPSFHHSGCRSLKNQQEANNTYHSSPLGYKGTDKLCKPCYTRQQFAIARGGRVATVVVTYEYCKYVRTCVACLKYAQHDSCTTGEEDSPRVFRRYPRVRTYSMYASYRLVGSLRPLILPRAYIQGMRGVTNLTVDNVTQHILGQIPIYHTYE